MILVVKCLWRSRVTFQSDSKEAVQSVYDGIVLKLSNFWKTPMKEMYCLKATNFKIDDILVRSESLLDYLTQISH